MGSNSDDKASSDEPIPILNISKILSDGPLDRNKEKQEIIHYTHLATPNAIRPTPKVASDLT